MAFIHRLQPQKFTMTAEATAGGTTYVLAVFPPGCAVAQIQVLNGSSTTIDFKLQASNSTSGAWFNVTPAPTSATTGASRVASTYTNLVFDRLRISTTDAWTASTGTYTFWVSAR